MLLQSLYDFAQRKKLLDHLPFQMRTVHLLIPLKKDGTLRGAGLVRQFTIISDGNKEKEVLGRERWLPRFPGENNGGKAYFLAEKCSAILGFNPETGEALPIEPRNRSEKFPVLAYRHFWQRIDYAYASTRDERLLALKKFRESHLPERDNLVVPQLPFVEQRTNEKTGKPEWGARTDAGEWISFAKANTLSFEVDGQFVFSDVEDDAIRAFWVKTYHLEAEDAEAPGKPEDSSIPTFCLVSGQQGQPIARSHKPKILGVPGLAVGGYIVSFAREAPAFSSFGFEMGENAPVSQAAAAAYALALNDLLANEDTCLRVGEISICFWANGAPHIAKQIGRLTSRPNPKGVRKFMVTPFAGHERELARKNHFHSVILSGNAGRVVVRSWIRETLEEAIDHFAQWFQDLEIVQFSRSDDGDEANLSSPYSVFRLAAATVRDSKELKNKSDLIGQLYRVALEGLRPPLGMLKPILDQVVSALVKKDPKRPWSNPSRFALIKLILKRNPMEEFQPMPYLAKTEDQAYNLGRLLAIFGRLQKESHKKKSEAKESQQQTLEGPGIVERYYSGTSAAPATTLPILWKLHQFHLRKLDQLKKNSTAQAFRIQIADISSQLPPEEKGGPPRVKRILTLEEQGRFALGFYQQIAFDRKASQVRHFLNEARIAIKSNKPDEAKQFQTRAQTIAQESGYAELVSMVTSIP